MATRITHEEKERLEEQLKAQCSLPREIIAELVEHTTPISYPKGGTIFLQGSTPDVAFCILAGLVKVYHLNPDGGRVLVKLAGRGGFIGFADIIEPSGRRRQAFEAEAMTKASLALFTRDHVVRALQELSQQSLVSLIERLNTSWSSEFASYAGFLALPYRQRLETLFADLAERFGVKDSRGLLLTLELSHDDLAEMIASSRPMATRLVGELMDEQVITRQGKHYIVLNTLGAHLVQSLSNGRRSNPVRSHAETPVPPRVARVANG